MSVALESAADSFRADSAGLHVTPEEFDAAEFEEGWRYELIEGLLIVSPSPSSGERDATDTLAYLLRAYQRGPYRAHLDATLPEQTLAIGENRRRCDRAVWTGLGRIPTADDVPSIIIEIVSPGRRNRRRDYELKRAEYREFGCREYWIIDRFARTLTVVRYGGPQDAERVYPGDAVYTTPLLPGFELPLQELFDSAAQWPEPGALAN